MFFVNDKSNNAFGGKADESGMIGINYGLVDSIINIVNKNRDYLHTSRVGKVLELSGLSELNIESIISQACLLFLFYHELGHVIQQSETPKQMMREKIESEDKTPNGYDSHVLETDSDEFASNIVSNIHIQYWKTTLNTLDSSLCSEILHAIVVVSSVSIFALFKELGGTFMVPSSYYLSTHPHEVIRISSFLSLFINEVAKEDPTISKQDIMEDLAKILKVLFPVEFSNYINCLKNDRARIQDYSSDLLKERSVDKNLAGSKMKELIAKLKLS